MVLWFKYSIVWKGTVPKQGTKNLVQPSATPTSNWSDVGRRKFTLITPGRFSIKRRSLYVSRLSDVKFSIPYYISSISLSKGQSRPLPCLLTSGNAINLIARNTPHPHPKKNQTNNSNLNSNLLTAFFCLLQSLLLGTSAKRERGLMGPPLPIFPRAPCQPEEERLGTRLCILRETRNGKQGTGNNGRYPLAGQ